MVPEAAVVSGVQVVLGKGLGIVINFGSGCWSQDWPRFRKWLLVSEVGLISEVLWFFGSGFGFGFGDWGNFGS